MNVLTVEGFVENGKVQLPDNLQLPAHHRVFVVIPNVSDVPVAAIRSPRLADPLRIGDFAKHIVAEVAADGEL